MSAIIERINKLVALAQSSNENEARNAAVQACKLMVQHKVVLAIPSAPPPAQTYRNVRTNERPTQSVEDVMNNGTPIDVTNIVDSIFGKDAGDRFRRARDANTVAETMNAPMDGICRDCAEPFKAGDRIWHRRGVGSVHTMKCNPDILNRKAPPR